MRKRLMMSVVAVSLSLILSLLTPYVVLADQPDIVEIKKMITIRCIEDEINTQEQCQCVADAVFKRFTLDELLKVNSGDATGVETKVMTDWFATNPCGATYRLAD